VEHGEDMKALNLTGMRFGRLLVIRRAANIGKKTAWFCLCDCGNNTIVKSTSIIEGKTKSCGCLHNDVRRKIALKHGLSNTNCRLYKTWESMKARCNNPKFNGYNNYGGRGIKICPDWVSFENFYRWAINNGYSDGLTIDRIDNNGNYEPGNCRWATRKTQARNRRTNKSITFDGITKTYAEWDEYLGFPVGTIARRKIKNWSDEQAITTILKRRPQNAAL
jgi:hypothetical protein